MMKPLPRVIAIFFLFSPVTAILADGTITKIAIESDGAVDGNGKFGRAFGRAFNNPVIDVSGNVAFLGQLTNTTQGFFDSTGIFLHDGTQLKQIARAGQPAPGTAGNYLSFSTDLNNSITINAAGQIGVLCTVNGDPNITGNSHFLLTTNSVTLITHVGATDPRSLGLFDELFEPALNDHGKMAFFGKVEIDINDKPNGLFYGDENGVETIFMEDDVIPGNTVSFAAGFYYGFNNSGNSLVYANDTSDPSGGPEKILYLGTTNSFLEIVRKGDSLPGGDGEFEKFRPGGSLNNSNMVAFSADILNNAVGSAGGHGIYMATTNAAYELARNGTAGPNNITWTSFNVPVINDNGVAAFHARASAPAPQADGSGIFIGTTNGVTRLVASRTPAPDGGSGLLVFNGNTYPHVAINDSGQVVFRAGIGIFLADADGTLHTVARIGQELLGSTVDELEMTSVGKPTDAGYYDIGGQRPLNDAGQVAFWAELADGRDGVFRWNPPTPPTTISAVAFDTNDTVLSVSTISGKSYQLKRRSSLTTGNWSNEGNVVPGTGAPLELRHPNAKANFDEQYYEIEITEP